MLQRSIAIDGANTLLDIGCGKGGIMQIINLNNNFHSIGVDIFDDYLNECRSNKTHNELIQCDINHLPFRDNAVEISLCCEVIEHLEQNKALALIKDVERISSQKIIITTPVGFKKEDQLEGNIFQEHVSGWLPKDFQTRGYIVRGQGLPLSGEMIYRLVNKGARTLSAEEEKQTAFDYFLLAISSLINLTLFAFRPFAYVFPRLALHMFCVKNKSK